MTPYLVGVVGVLGGGVIALIVYILYKNAKHKLELKVIDYNSLKKRHEDESTENAQLKAENEKIRKERDGYIEQVRKLRIASGDAAETNLALNELFLLPRF